MVENFVAVVSDIHANFEALTAVCQDIRKSKYKIKKIISTGDVIGYGPNPSECVKIANTFVNLDGNHEVAKRAKSASPDLPLKMHPRATYSLEREINRESGEIRLRTSTGIILNLPEETLETFLDPNQTETYIREVIKEEIERPERKLIIPKECRKKLNLKKDKVLVKLLAAFIHDIPENCPEFYPTINERIRRRNNAIEMHEFLEKVKTKRFHELGDTLFVHDNVFEPAGGGYMLDRETAKKLGISENIIKIENITPTKLKKYGGPKIKNVVFGHTHGKPKKVIQNGIHFVQIGSVGFPREKPRNSKDRYIIPAESLENLGDDISVAYYTIMVFENRTAVEIRARAVPYDNTKTKRKMKAAGLDYKILLNSKLK